MNTSLKIYKRISVLVQLTLIVFVAVASVKAQTSSVDSSFNSIPDKNLSSAPNFTIQPDNKIVVFGNFQVANGAVKSKIARFNTDGSLDNSFDCVSCNSTIENVVSQPDGKLLVSGSVLVSASPFTTTAGVIYRLNADGSRDIGFTSPFVPPTPNPIGNVTQTAVVNNVQADGKILVILYSVSSGSPFTYLYRLNTDGTLDNSFPPLGVGSGVSVHTSPAKIISLPDGKILIAYNTSSGAGTSAAIYRYNSDGSTDSTFERPSFQSLQSSISDLDVLSDGSFIVVGSFSTINGFSRANIAKLQSAGNVDTSFPNLSITGINRVRVLSDGKILVATSNRIYRLNADGSLDNSFNAPTNIAQINSFKIDSAGRIILYGTFIENGVNVSKFARLNQDGSLDNSLNLNLGAAVSITAVAAQPDGRIIYAGDFVRVGGVPRVSIVRVNADGSLDTTFNSGSGFTGTVSKVLVQSDGKILVGGAFSAYNGTSRRAFVRLNADSSLDNSFNPNIPMGTVNTIALQPDGKILIGGTFASAGGQTRTSVARFNADGSLDESFNPVFGANTSIAGVAVQSDGKILVGGTFSGVNGFNRTNLVRLNSDGSFDNNFNAGTIAAVRQVEILADGRYLVLTTTIVRLNNNGTTDTTFLSPTFNGTVNQFLAQADNSILIGGSFSAINNAPRSNFARLRPNGVLDRLFLPGGANGAVRAIAGQTDGRILVGGDFSLIDNTARLSVARINIAPYRLITPYDYDGDSRADLTVFRPSNGYWYELNIQNNGFYAVQFGQSGDKTAPADYDGDGKTDIAVFRDVVPGAGNFAYFYILNSSDNSFRFGQFGVTGDVPMAGDWDGDGKADLAVYRSGTAGGQSYFYYRPSSQPSVNYYTLPFGIQGDKPVLGDFDGDGRLDPATFRPQNGYGYWSVLQSSVNQVTGVSFGLPTDIPVPADYDGDGKTNIAVFRPSNGTWFTSTNAQNNYGSVQFGASEDLPVPADYDGDGRADVAVFRPSTGAWYLNRSTQGFTGVQFGQSGDKPSPNAFIR